MQSLLYCLHASEKEMLFLEKMAKDELECKSPKSKSVTFESDSSAWSLNEFFACFAIEFDPNKIKASNTAVVHSSVVAVNFKSDGMDKLGRRPIGYKFIYACLFYSNLFYFQLNYCSLGV